MNAYGKNVIIKKSKEKETATKTGIVLVADTKNKDGVMVKIKIGEVLSVGDKVKNLKVGDQVFFNPYDAFNLDEKGEKMIINYVGIVAKYV